MKAKKVFLNGMIPIFTLTNLSQACEASQSHKQNRSQQFYSRILNYQTDLVEKERWEADELTFTDKEQCLHAINFYNSLNPDSSIPNPYEQIADKHKAFLFKSLDPELYYTLQPTKLMQVQIEMSYSDIHEVADGQTVNLYCPVPLQWKLQLYRDADIIFPPILKDFATPAITDPNTLGLGAKGGFAFQHLDSIGHEVFFSWSLKEKTSSKQQLLNEIQENFSFIDLNNAVFEVSDLIKKSVPDPLAIIAFIDDPNTMKIDSLFIKHLPSFQGELMLSPYYSDYANSFDYAIGSPFESMQINGSLALVALRHIQYPSLNVTPCRYEAPITSAENCYTYNKRYIFSKFNKLFDRQAASNPNKTCILAYYQTSLASAEGLTKLICIDARGNLALKYNALHLYISDAINEIRNLRQEI